MNRPKSSLSLHRRGTSLIIVMLVLLLASLVVVASSRLGWLNQILVGSEADHARAFAAAEALIRDAENDIRGQHADGSATCPPTEGHVGCRHWKAGLPFFPQDHDDFDSLAARVAGGPHSCRQGICLPASTDSLDTALLAANLAAMTAGEGDNAVAARYGEHTGASPGADGNPLLSARSPSRAWYWVEVFRYSEAPGLTASSHSPVPDASRPFVYRINAHVQGLKPGTRVWLRSVFVPFPREQLD